MHIRLNVTNALHRNGTWAVILLEGIAVGRSARPIFLDSADSEKSGQ